MDWKEHKKKLMRHADFRQKFVELEPEYKLIAEKVRKLPEKEQTQEKPADSSSGEQENTDPPSLQLPLC